DEIERCLIAPHPRKKVGGWNEDGKLQFRLVALIGDVKGVEAGTIHADVDRSAVGRSRRTLECREVAHSMLSLEGVDAGGVLEGIIRTQEQVFQKRWTAAIPALVFGANRWYGIGPEGILDALGKRFVGYRIEL